MALKAILFQALRPNLANIGTRTIVSKALKEKREKPAPFPYLEKRYRQWHEMVDKTTLRLDENSKLIVVEGAHAIGKSKFAKELAEEFDMVYMPPPDMSQIYIHPTYKDIDFRKWNDLYPSFYKIMDEKDFVRNPLGVAHGAVDRFLLFNYQLKLQDHIKAIRHILNTGEGVVMEQCPNSDYIYFNAMYNAGWIQPETKKCYDMFYPRSLVEVLKPNVIVYLDAPVDVVQNNIKKRGNEWDQNSPLWSNTSYLNEIYNEFKSAYLKDIQQYSRVLVYDWSEGGDLEIVVEDIEKTELDNIELYDDQQRDWRFSNEEGATRIRKQFTHPRWIDHKLKSTVCFESFFADTLMADEPIVEEMEQIMRWVKNINFQEGWNREDEGRAMKMIIGDWSNEDYKRFAAMKWNLFYEPYDTLLPYEAANSEGLK